MTEPSRPYFLVLRFTRSGYVVAIEARKRSDAALLLFNRTVDAMVRDHASLDTSHGIAAQKQARATTAPKARGTSAETADRSVSHRNECVTLRLMRA